MSKNPGPRRGVSERPETEGVWDAGGRSVWEGGHGRGEAGVSESVCGVLWCGDGVGEQTSGGRGGSTDTTPQGGR